MERSEFDDDEQYPVAPIPAHERVWRHPSEVGSAHWVRSEPPLTIGRGLFVGTSALGGLLALAVVWAMLPTTSGSVAVVSSTVAITPAATTRPPQPLSTQAALRSTSAELETFAAPASTIAASVSSLAARIEPSPTEASEPPPSVVIGATIGVAELPIAVALSEVSLVITTAQAAANRSTFAVAIEGHRVMARVVLVDADTGVAVLDVDEPPTVWHTIASAPAVGDTVRVMGSAATEAQIVQGSDGKLSLTAWGDDAEGSMVIDTAGNLVGMCTHGASGYGLVTVAHLSGMQPKPPAHDPGWLGVEVSVDATTSDVVIQSVDGSGPAAGAGVAAGDVILVFGGLAVTSVDQVRHWLADTSPGATVEMRLRRADGSETTVSITTGTRPPSI